MQRHPSLRPLSRDHHSALVLARRLRDPPAASAEGLLKGICEAWTSELAPHFLLEDRELVPLGLCGEAALREHTERIQRQHAELRAGFGRLGRDNLESLGPELGEALEAHVRFEERQWFPALEACLDEATLAALALRLQQEPKARITGYQPESEGVWIAELDCGHTQHVRHQPPFRTAPWVLTPEGRDQMTGSPLTCPLCRMPRMPPCARVYKQTSDFDTKSVPAGLLRSHRLRAGTWGRIEVLEGRVRYVLEDEADLTLTLRPGIPGTVAPERPHHVELEPGARFRVCFLEVR